MAKFVVGQDQTVESDEPMLEVVLDRAGPLKIGKHVFQLIVADDAGNASEPASVTIIVVDRDRPTAVIDVIDDNNERNPAPSVEIPFGAAFTLTGEKSTDVGGVVKSFTWTLLQ